MPCKCKSVKQILHNVKQNSAYNDTIFNSFTHGGVLELADRQDLGSCAGRREGSSPSFPTKCVVVGQPLIPQHLFIGPTTCSDFLH